MMYGFGQHPAHPVVALFADGSEPPPPRSAPCLNANTDVGTNALSVNCFPKPSAPILKPQKGALEARTIEFYLHANQCHAT